jgi:PKD repeat protein
LNGRCQPDFDDIRFTGSDGETLVADVTIREQTDSSMAEFKVNVVESPIYIYYGNLTVLGVYSDESFSSGTLGDTDELTESYVTSGGGQISGIARESPVTGFATSLEAEVSSDVGSTAQMALLLMNDCREYTESNVDGLRIVAITETKNIVNTDKGRVVFDFETPVPIFKDTVYGIALWAGAGTEVWYETGAGEGSFYLDDGFSGDLVDYTGSLGNRAYGRFLNYERVDVDEQNVLFRDNVDYTESRSLWHQHYEREGSIDAEAGQGICDSYAFNSTVTPPKNIGWGELAFKGEVSDGNKRFWSSVVRLSTLPEMDCHIELVAILHFDPWTSLNGFGVDRTAAGVQWRLSLRSEAYVWNHTLFGEVEANTDYLVILSYETDGVEAKTEVWVTKLDEPNLLEEASPSATRTVETDAYGDLFFIGAADYPLDILSPTSAFFDEMMLTEDFPATFGAWGNEEVSAELPEYIFSDDFEDGTLDAWTGTYTTEGESVTVVSTDSPYNGTYHLRAAHDGGASHEGAYCYKSLYGMSTIFFRQYTKFSDLPNVDNRIEFQDFVSAEDDSIGVGAQLGQNADGYRWEIWYYAAGWKVAYSNLFTPETDHWYCTETKVYVHDTNGEIRFYVDEVEVITKTGIAFTDFDYINTIKSGAVWTASAQAHTIWTDTIAISDTYIGPENSQPSANFVASPTSGTDPLSVTFTDLSTSYDGITSWLWDFGDGDTSTEQNPTHIYAEGTYTVSLTVTEADTDSDIETKIDYISVTPPTYTITASSGTGGSIAPSGEVIVDEGTDQLFTITADQSYQVADVLVDKSSIGAVETYEFTDVAASHTIEASFELVTTPVVDGVGIWSFTDGVWIPEGGTVAQGDSIRILAYITNPEEPVSISYGPTGDTLTTTTASYNSDWNYYYIDITVPATLGLYDVQVDSDTTSTTFSERYEVVTSKL